MLALVWKNKRAEILKNFSLELQPEYENQAAAGELQFGSNMSDTMKALL